MFIINGLIGEGGFGKVMTAMFVKDSNWYAIKETSKGSLKYKGMILGELAALKRLSHPFIVNLHFAFQDKRNCYFVVDLRTGGDLRYYLREKVIFEERTVAFYVACISSALDHIHSKRIIHRDIKPENVILDEKGFPYLVDFGVAHLQSESFPDEPLTSELASGTKQYLAPEVFCRDHIHGPECDYFSLGVLAYELLFGKRPFEKHCPTTFITFLEKGYAAKQKQLQVLASSQQSRSLSSRTSSGSSTSGSILNFGASIDGLSTREGGSNPGSRASTFMSTAESVSPRLPNLVCPLVESSTNGSGGVFCSSVGYTNPSSNCSSPLVSPKKPLSMTNTSESGWMSVATGKMDSPSRKEPNFMGIADESLLCSPSRESRCLTPPLPLKGVSRDGLASFGKPPSYNTSNPTSLDENRTSTEVEGHCGIFGNHWYHSSSVRVPRVHVPLSNRWLGELSDQCVDMLNGLFEVRPARRLGGRNIDTLKNHPWLRLHGASDWDELHKKHYQPDLAPGKVFIKEKLKERSCVSCGMTIGPKNFYGDGVGRAAGSYCDFMEDIATEDDIELEATTERAFRDFRYISPIQQQLLLTKEEMAKNEEVSAPTPSACPPKSPKPPRGGTVSSIRATVGQARSFISGKKVRK